MPDNWSYVLAAYGLAAGALIAYWRSIVRRSRSLGARRARHTERGA